MQLLFAFLAKRTPVLHLETSQSTTLFEYAAELRGAANTTPSAILDFDFGPSKRQQRMTVLLIEPRSTPMQSTFGERCS